MHGRMLHFHSFFFLCGPSKTRAVISLTRLLRQCPSKEVFFFHPRRSALPLPSLRQDLQDVGSQENTHRLSLQELAAEETQVSPEKQQSQSVQE